ncbi:MAG: ABC transporter permease [Candidatus Limnocylindrales bacterium]
MGRMGLLAATIAVLLFMYVPLSLVIAYAFNTSGTQAWPPAGFTLHWVQEGLANKGLIDAFMTSVGAALAATFVAIILGSLAALAVSRHKFFGRDSVSFLLVLPISLPGVVTGMALSTTFATTDLPLGFMAIVVGHATFCVVLVYNNVLARMRRISGPLEEASADLGADSFQTFRFVTFPHMRSAIMAGALLAFALSFDEVIVTIFVAGGVKTLPLWIFQSFRLANQVALVNVAGLAAILLSVIPVYVATRLTADAGSVGRT